LSEKGKYLKTIKLSHAIVNLKQNNKPISSTVIYHIIADKDVSIDLCPHNVMMKLVIVDNCAKIENFKSTSMLQYIQNQPLEKAGDSSQDKKFLEGSLLCNILDKYSQLIVKKEGRELNSIALQLVPI